MRPCWGSSKISKRHLRYDSSPSSKHEAAALEPCCTEIASHATPVDAWRQALQSELEEASKERETLAATMLVGNATSAAREAALESEVERLRSYLYDALAMAVDVANHLEAAAHDIVRYAAPATPPPGTPEPLSPRVAASSATPEPLISPTAPTMTAQKQRPVPPVARQREESGGGESRQWEESMEARRRNEKASTRKGWRY